MTYIKPEVNKFYKNHSNEIVKIKSISADGTVKLFNFQDNSNHYKDIKNVLLKEEVQRKTHVSTEKAKLSHSRFSIKY